MTFRLLSISVILALIIVSTTSCIIINNPTQTQTQTQNLSPVTSSVTKTVSVTPTAAQTDINELHNIQTSVMAMLAKSTSGQLDAAITIPTTDMSTVVATFKVSGDLKLSSYMTGLIDGRMVKSAHKYTFALDGTVTQH
jgi:hypothetical protein